MNIKKIILSLFFTMISSITFAGDELSVYKVNSQNFEQVKEVCADKYSGQTYKSFFVNTFERAYETTNIYDVFDKVEANHCIAIIGFVSGGGNFFMDKKFILNRKPDHFKKFLKFFEIKHDFDVKTQLTSN